MIGAWWCGVGRVQCLTQCSLSVLIILACSDWGVRDLPGCVWVAGCARCCGGWDSLVLLRVRIVRSIQGMGGDCMGCDAYICWISGWWLVAFVAWDWG